MKKIITLLVFGILSIPCIVCAQEKKMTNETVMNMLELGFSEDVIASKISASECEFDTSIETLQLMKEAGVSSGIIVAMLNKQKENREEEEANKEIVTGIFYEENNQLVRIYPTSFSGTKTSTLGSALTYGLADSKIRSTMVGASSRNVIKTTYPEFYFFFAKKEKENSSIDWWFSVAPSPHQFVLSKLKAKKNRRELGTGKVNLYSGSSIGVDENDIIGIKIQHVGGNAFKVTPEKVLEPGEYCFFYQGMIPMGGYNNQAVFDFSISPNADSSISKYVILYGCVLMIRCR